MRARSSQRLRCESQRLAASEPTPAPLLNAPSAAVEASDVRGCVPWERFLKPHSGPRLNIRGELLRSRGAPQMFRRPSFVVTWPSAREIAAKLGGGTRPDGSGNYACHCPGPMHKNGDANPSLSVTDGKNGR